ncbi:hypothetical protein L9F63_016806, partial [Diploptera punctata]
DGVGVTISFVTGSSSLTGRTVLLGSIAVLPTIPLFYLQGCILQPFWGQARLDPPSPATEPGGR